MLKPYQVGVSKFRDKAIADEVAANRAKLAAAFNAKNMTAEEKADAFAKFFNLKGH